VEGLGLSQDSYGTGYILMKILVFLTNTSVFHPSRVSGFQELCFLKRNGGGLHRVGIANESDQVT
jgi:hypothetical protein